MTAKCYAPDLPVLYSETETLTLTFKKKVPLLREDSITEFSLHLFRSASAVEVGHNAHRRAPGCNTTKTHLEALQMLMITVLLGSVPLYFVL